MTLQEAYITFIKWGRVERNYAKETLVKHRDCFRVWILPRFGERKLDSITRLDVMELRSAMVDQGVGTARQYSVLMTLKTFLKFCREILGQSCLDPDEINLPKRQKPHVVYLTNEEIRQLEAAIALNTFAGRRLYTLIELSLGTGLRSSEALALNRKPFEQGMSEFQIRGKGNKLRSVFITPALTETIRKYLFYRRDDHPALFVTTGFPRRLSRSDLSRMFIRLREKAGIDKRVTPHMLRHTYCTNLLNNGADIMFIKELAGHADIQTTAKYYLGVDKRALRKVVDSCLNYSVDEEHKLIN